MPHREIGGGEGRLREVAEGEVVPVGERQAHHAEADDAFFVSIGEGQIPARGRGRFGCRGHAVIIC
jgi:hypothetical protein